MEKGQFNDAFATAERGISIDSSDALLWNLMAQIRLKQDNYMQAEQLAKKSNLLTKDRSLQAKNWRIISEALRGKGAASESKKALFKALELETERAGG
ncbi:MAG: tetratricopeptide repeat protein [Desulfobacteraceae bacterium]|nr:tetratricopeptide repeat protein [Desulfobacteraceae bacterium]